MCTINVLFQFYEKHLDFENEKDLIRYHLQDEDRKKQWEKIKMFREIQENKLIFEMQSYRRRWLELNQGQVNNDQMKKDLLHYLERIHVIDT